MRALSFSSVFRVAGAATAAANNDQAASDDESKDLTIHNTTVYIIIVLYCIDVDENNTNHLTFTYNIF